MNYPHILTVDNAGFDVDLVRYDEHTREIAIGTIAKVLEVDEGTIRYAFKSKAPELATLQQFKLRSAQIGRLRFTTMPLEAAGIILQYHASKGNAKGIAWLNANWQQNLEREADAFEGIVNTREQYKVELTDNYQQILARINRKIEVMNLRQSDGITDEQYQALVAEEEQLKKQMSYTEQDLAHAERNVVTLARLVKEAPVSEVREPLQRELAWHTENRDRLRQVVGQALSWCNNIDTTLLTPWLLNPV